jgi:hypothetical protein
MNTVITAPTEEQQMLALMTFDQRQEYRKRQFRERVQARAEAERLEYEAAMALAEQQRLEAKAAQKKRQEANRAARVASDQAIRAARNGNRK